MIAQVIIGVSIGTQYKHEFLTRLLRLLLSSLVTVPFALVMLALLAALFSAMIGLPLTTLVLAVAPAGIAEMSLTGQVLGLDAALITGFQIVRIMLVLSVARRPPGCSSGWWRGGRELAGGAPGGRPSSVPCDLDHEEVASG